MNFNLEFHNVFEQLLYRIEAIGPFIPILAWMSVFFATVVIGFTLKKPLSRKVWIPALIVGCVSLAAHLLDYFVTLHVSPSLTEEANPIWRIVIDNYGLKIAKAYGLTGKVLLSILSFELFAYYLIQRERFFPETSENFLSFWRKFGVSDRKKPTLCLSNIINFFSFAFALVGPFYFYVALLNSMVNNLSYYLLPSMPLMLLIYLAGVTITYFVMTYRASRFSKER